jgi:steroid 5-alpha reductase family enzyme
MKILQTAFLLIVTLVVVPIFSYFFGTPLNQVTVDTLNTLATITAVAIAYCFVLGEITNNNSQVDKLWSILPIVYVWIVAYSGDFSPRLVLMAVLVTLWGLRLTYNFSRHGAFTIRFWEGHEDYRWAVLRAKPEFQGKWKWTLFNLFFICGYQQILILLFTLPIIIALQFNDTPLSLFDWIIALAMVLFIVFEAVADQQHWNYQSKKWKMIEHKEIIEGDFKKGFLDKGLWAYSRHPNYFAEQAVWVCFYLFSITASHQWLNWSIAGCLLLIILFQGSANFSEEISSGKYPEYVSYQKRVAKFIGVPKKKQSKK